MSNRTIEQVKQAIVAKLAECKQIAAAKGKPFDCHLKLLWTGGAGGHYDHKNKEIAVNIALAIKNDENYDHVVNVTVPHEAAHAIQRQHYPVIRQGKSVLIHDHNWAYIMNTFFHLPATRCHKMDTQGVKQTRAKAPRPYHYACRCREHNLTILIHNKIKNGAKYFCKSCKGQIQLVRIGA